MKKEIDGISFDDDVEIAPDDCDIPLAILRARSVISVLEVAKQASDSREKIYWLTYANARLHECLAALGEDT